MKKKKLILSLVFIFIIAIGGIATYIYKNKDQVVSGAVESTDAKTTPNNELRLTTDQKLEDFNYTYKILKENFPFFEVEKRKTGYDWLAHKEEFEDAIKETKNDLEFYKKMNEIITRVQNAHTEIIEPAWYEDFKNSYNKYTDMAQWNFILNNKDVIDKNKYWKEILNKENDDGVFIIPVIFKYVQGSYCSTTVFGYNCESYGIPIGSILNKIDGIAADTYVKSLMNTKYLTYDFKRKKLIKSMLGIFGKEDEQVRLTLKTPNGETIEKTIKSEKYNNESAKSTLNSKENAITKIMVAKKVGYISIASMEQDYSKDQININNFINQIKDYPYLIIDIRGNGGGSDSYWSENIVKPLLNNQVTYEPFLVFRDGEYIKPFLEEKLQYKETIAAIKDLPKGMKYPSDINTGFIGFTKLKHEFNPLNSINFKGKIYLLVDDGVYSSSESFAAFAKGTKWATLVGTTTGGDGIGVDPCVASMPNSGLVFRFSLDMGLNCDGTANEETHTMPDIYIEPSYKDMIKTIEWEKNNKDEVINPYDTILNKVLEIAK